MTEPHSICAVCAWRETCQKKFSLSGRDVNCSDFTRDVTIKSGNADSRKPENTETK